MCCTSCGSSKSALPLELPLPVWIVQNPAADCSKGSQLLSGNSSGRSPLNTQKPRCNQPGWNSGKCWLWSLRKKEHGSGREEANLPAHPFPPSTCRARPDPRSPFSRPAIHSRKRGASSPGRDLSLWQSPGSRCMWTRMFCDCYFFWSLASARNLSVVVSKAKHEPGFSIMVAILACNFITRI